MKKQESAFASATSISSEQVFENKENKIASATAESLGPIKWLTTNEAARYLRVSISSIKTMIYRGQVRVYKLGRRNRFLMNELERLITLPLAK
jgi:excisionase family DNA binding protein